MNRRHHRTAIARIPAHEEPVFALPSPLIVGDPDGRDAMATGTALRESDESI